MTRYGLHGQLRATSGNGDQLADILLEAARLVADAPGCRVYLISKTAEDPDAVWVTEVWDSKADHDRSLENDQVRALIGRAMPLLAGRPTGGQEFTVLGGVGVPT